MLGECDEVEIARVDSESTIKVGYRQYFTEDALLSSFTKNMSQGE